MCQKLEAEKITLPRSHTIFLRYQVDFNSRKKEREKERDDVVLASTLFIKNKKKIFFLHFTLHHFLLSVCSNGKKKYDVIFQETGLLPTK